MIVKLHKIGSQEIFTTSGLTIRLGDLQPSEVLAISVKEETGKKLFENPKAFTVKRDKDGKHKLFDKVKNKHLEL